MQMEQALAGVETLERSGAVAEITGVQYDSRRVRPGDAFIAMRGGLSDGNRFIEQALVRGATAIVTDSAEAYAVRRPGVAAYAFAAHGRRALAGIAANLLDHPERKLKISAVTGTNGKTTTAFLLEQMLRSVGRTTVLIGTIETRVAGEARPSVHTTPEASDLLEIFADGVRAGATEVVMEMSSHALEQERVWGIPVDVAIFTNLTQDHLDYHGTMEAYGAAKAKLFAGLGAPSPRIAVLNRDDDFGAKLARSISGAITYSLSSKPAHYASNILTADRSKLAAGNSKTTYDWHTLSGIRQVRSPLTARVNIYNLLAASIAAHARGLTLDEIVEVVPSLQQVPGRFQTVPNDLGITVVVDYAHTDDALGNLIVLARDLVQPAGGRVITLFGCGGDRDRTKRPKMGRAAGAGSDLVILTSDNPRSEDPQVILEEALSGVRETLTECIVEADRAAAIEVAIRRAQPGDIVLLAGKGHEKVQILGDRTIPFDDVAIAGETLRRIERQSIAPPPPSSIFPLSRAITTGLCTKAEAKDEDKQ